MKYEVRGYCAKPHAAGRFLPFRSSMQEEGRFLATEPRSGTRGERFPSDFDACGGFSQRNPRSPTDRRERADGFRARTRFRGQKREVSRHRRMPGLARRWDRRAPKRAERLRASGRARRRGRGFGATSERGVGARRRGRELLTLERGFAASHARHPFARSAVAPLPRGRGRAQRRARHGVVARVMAASGAV